jgi:hypothetical protein
MIKLLLHSDDTDDDDDDYYFSMLRKYRALNTFITFFT